MAGREDKPNVRLETGLLLWIIPSLAGCVSHHLLDADWQSLPAKAKETRAIETVRTVVAERGARIPGRPSTQENEVLFVDRRLAVYRPCEKLSGRDVSPSNVAVLLFDDITGLERRVVYDFPSHPEDLSIYLRRSSPSVWGVQADEPLLSPLLSTVGLKAPVTLFPQRPRQTYQRLETALKYLLSLPPPREGVGPAVELILRRCVKEKCGRGRFEAEVLERIRGLRR